MSVRPSFGHETKVERYADLAEAARRLGRRAAADRYLLLAWAAFEAVELQGFGPPPANGSETAQIVPFPRPD